MTESILLGDGRDSVCLKRLLNRMDVVRTAAERKISQKDAAEKLGITVRHLRRLIRRFRRQGPRGLISRRIGRRPNNAIPESVRRKIMEPVHRDYFDFGPALACEQLKKHHGITVSAETLRKWMAEEGLRKPKQKRKAGIHPPRERRARRGELVQIDGSRHAWLEERRGKCVLTAFIDDATGELGALRFSEAETTQAYMEALRQYLKKHGRMGACYSDRHSIFSVNRPGMEGAPTQLGRAFRTLDIQLILASTPQAKGRVERLFRTLQDRLVKVMRLRGISDLDGANAFLDEFMEEYNRTFAVQPRNPEDAHRPVLHKPEELDLILCRHHKRRLSRNLTFQLKNRLHQITGRGRGYRLQGRLVTVCEAWDGRITVMHEGRILDWKTAARGEPPLPEGDGKSIGRIVDRALARQAARPRYKPAPDHPWRRLRL